MIEQSVPLQERVRSLQAAGHPNALEFVAAKRIADVAHESTSGNWWEDWRRQRPNPWYSQTEEGLIVVRGHGGRQVFDTLMTPWGELHTVGSRSGIIFDQEKFLEEVTLEPFGTPPPSVVSFSAHFGEYYGVKSVGGLTLPRASLRERPNNYFKTGDSWKALQDTYNSVVPPREAPRTRR